MLQAIVQRVGLALARRALAEPGERRVAARGLWERAEVLRDGRGVTHIFADTAHDLFFAQGWAHAEDRLFQMDLTRRAVAGRLSEIFGDMPISWTETSVRFKGYRLPELDYYLRILGLRRAAEESLSVLGGEAQEALAAFAAGVNAWMEEAASGGRTGRRWRRVGRRGPGWPIEMRLLGYEPEPWTPADSLSVLKGMALQLNFALKSKLCLVALAEKLSDRPALARELLPPEYPPEAPRVAAAPRDLAAAAASAAEILGADGQFRAFVGWAGTHVGSNWLVLGGGRTTTGKPILVSDPHLQLPAPPLFYLNRLRGGPYDVAGASLPGVPGVALGRNRRIAWGFTNLMLDDTDLYLETVHPLDPLRYRAGDEWARFRTIEERIRVKGERAPRRRVVRVSRNGPIVSDAFRANGGESSDSRPGAALAVRWTAAAPTAEVGALLAMNRASNWAEFVEACREVTAPAQNVGYADVDGNIGYYCAGRIPIRANGRNVLPADGARGEGAWTGFVPFEEQPHLFNPAAGYIASANNKPVDDAYPHYISAFFDAPYRARRLHEIVRETPQLSPEAAERVPLDVLSIQARDIVNLLVRPLEDRLKEMASAEVHVALNYILNWDFRCTADSIAASIFHVFYLELLRAVFEPTLGEELFLHFVENWNEHCSTVEAILANPQSAWFEGRPREELVSRAFARAVEWLAARLGKPTQAWSWGKLHRLTLRHAFHALPPLRRLFDIGPFPTPGSGTTLNNGQWLAGEPFEHVGGAGFRQIADLSQSAVTRVALPGGQSANPASPHHHDLIRDWLEGRTFPIELEREKVAPAERTLLEPRLF